MNRLTSTSESCISKLWLHGDSDIKSSKIYRPVLVFYGYTWILLLIHLKRFLDFTIVSVIILGDFNIEVELEMKLKILVLRQWVCRDIGIYGNEIESSTNLPKPYSLAVILAFVFESGSCFFISLKMELLLLVGDDVHESDWKRPSL